MPTILPSYILFGAKNSSIEKAANMAPMITPSFSPQCRKNNTCDIYKYHCCSMKPVQTL